MFHSSNLPTRGVAPSVSADLSYSRSTLHSSVGVQLAQTGCVEFVISG